MIISLSNYIMEQDVSSASIDDIYEEQFAAQFDVASCIAEAYCKQLQMLEGVDDDYFTESEYFAEEFDNKQTWEATGNKIKDFFGKIWTAIKNALATVANWFIHMFQKVKGFFTGNTEEQVKKAVTKLENMSDEEKDAIVIQVPAAIFSSDASKRKTAGWTGGAATDWRESTAVFKLQIEILDKELFPCIDRVTKLMQDYQSDLEKDDGPRATKTSNNIGKEIDKFKYISNKILTGKHTRDKGLSTAAIDQHSYWTPEGEKRDYEIKDGKFKGAGAIQRGDKRGTLDNAEEIYTSPKKRYKLVDTSQFKSTGMIELRYGEIMGVLKTAEEIMLSGFKQRIESCEQSAKDLKREVDRLANYEELKGLLGGLTGDDLETRREELKRNVRKNRELDDIAKKRAIEDIDSYGEKNTRFDAYTGKKEGHTLNNIKEVSQKLTDFNTQLSEVFGKFREAYKKVFDGTKKVLDEVVKWDKKKSKGMYGDISSLSGRVKEVLEIEGKIKGLDARITKGDPAARREKEDLEYRKRQLMVKIDESPKEQAALAEARNRRAARG